MVATLDVRLALRDLLVGIRGVGNIFVEAGPRQDLDRPGVGDLVDAAADEQVTRRAAGGRMLDHLVHLELVVARAGLEEEILCQSSTEVARPEDVVAVPRPSL